MVWEGLIESRGSLELYSTDRSNAEVYTLRLWKPKRNRVQEREAHGGWIPIRTMSRRWAAPQVITWIKLRHCDQLQADIKDPTSGPACKRVWKALRLET